MNIIASICLDCFSALVLIAMTAVTLHRADRSISSKKAYMMAADIISMLVCDIVYCALYGRQTMAAISILVAAKTVYLAINSLLVWEWANFLGFTIWDRDYLTKKYRKVYNAALGVNICLAAVNLIYPVLFDIDSAGTFQLNLPGMLVFTVLNYTVCIISVCSMFINKKRIRTAEFEPMLLFIAMPIAGEIFSLFNREVSIVCMYAAGGLLLLLMLDNFAEYVDELTGLGNRRFLTETLEKWFSDSREMLICGILTDVDGLKKVNDTYGHTAGDEIIRSMADILYKACKYNMTIVRYFGDKFLVVWRAKSEDELAQLQKRIEEEKEKLNSNLPNSKTVHFSMGGNCCSNKVMTKEEFLSSMDRSMYVKKQEIDLIIDSALAEDSFQVYFQPVYSITEERFNTAEALLRLILPDKGFISPLEIIQAAERNGSIIRVGRAMFSKVCGFMASEEFKNLGVEKINFNLSVEECTTQDISKVILRMLAENNIPPRMLRIEVTESIWSVRDEVFMTNLNALADAGIEIVLDDYGTGYSNLCRMNGVPFSCIKIDKSLMDTIEEERTGIIIGGTVEMVKKLNMSVVAEGVETASQLEMAKELGIDYIQGYYYSKPLSINDFKDFMKKQIK